MRKGEYITTYTGMEFHIIDPRIEDISGADIAHALSLTCRANGHFKHFYSIAQHSLNCYNEAVARGYSKRVQLACLLHDGSEAYISDVTRPVKAHLPQYLEIESKIQSVVYERFGIVDLTSDEINQVSDVDDTVLWFEFEALHNMPMWSEQPVKYADFDFIFRNMLDVEKEFLRILKLLTNDFKALCEIENKGVNNFVETLSKEKFDENIYVHNQFSDKTISSNLRLFLNSLLKIKPTAFLVGEAAGYNGCNLTGIPFTSDYIISKNNFFKSSIGEISTNKEKMQKESSSTIVWETLERFNIIPLMWNAFPFHPYKEGNKLTNRSPNKEELKLGKKYIELLLNEFSSINLIVAVGNFAYSSLQEMELPIEIIKIRHPSNGGKKDFAKGVEKCLKHKIRS